MCIKQFHWALHPSISLSTAVYFTEILCPVQRYMLGWFCVL
jgi:hypothetical protein